MSSEIKKIVLPTDRAEGPARPSICRQWPARSRFWPAWTPIPSAESDRHGSQRLRSTFPRDVRGNASRNTQVAGDHIPGQPLARNLAAPAV